VLHLVSSWENVGALRRIGMLAAHFERAECEFHVAGLSARGPDPHSLVHCEIPFTSLAPGPRLTIALVWQLRRLAAEWGADVVHAWDRAVARLARRALGGQAGIRVVDAAVSASMPAVDAKRVRREADSGPSREQILARLGLPGESRLIGFCGRLTAEKRLTELLWAIDQIRCVRDDVYLLVLGDGPERPMFERYARLYEVAERVRFVGWQRRAAAWIAALDVYASASAAAACSLALLEAWALGVPVVAGDTAAHRRIVSPGETALLVDIHQRSEWARRCLQMLEEPGFASRIRQAGQTQVIERFPTGPWLEAHRRLYQAAR
jgi:glycosyltransferase involved in cell wall biosynthesis